MCGGPGGLEIEATRDAVQVDALSGEMESGNGSAFHAAEVDGLAADATAGHNLILVGGFADGLML